MSDIPQTNVWVNKSYCKTTADCPAFFDSDVSFLVGTFYAVSYSKTALAQFIKTVIESKTEKDFRSQNTNFEIHIEWDTSDIYCKNSKAKLLQLKLIHIFARAILLLKKSENEKNKPTFIVSVLKVEY